MKPQEETSEIVRKEISLMDNEMFLKAVKSFVLWQKMHLDSTIYLQELITRFERLSLGQQADEACKKAEELSQPFQDQEPDTLRRIIGEAIGEASMLWTPRPSDQVFESTKASALVDRVLERISKLPSELQQPTLQVGWEYMNERDQWVQIDSKDDHKVYPFNSKLNGAYTEQGEYLLGKKNTKNLILSTGRPVKKVQVDDEVEALAEKLFVSSLYEKSQLKVDSCFEFAEEFIQYRNERRGKNGK